MPKGGRLTIKSESCADDCKLTFSDTGTGIPDSMLQKLWSPLYTTKAKGMGFGLPVCKRIVEAHGGKITVETAVTKGTTFTINIPIKPPNSQEAYVSIVASSLPTVSTDGKARAHAKF
jgi:signal transduction histidine kinase